MTSLLRKHAEFPIAFVWLNFLRNAEFSSHARSSLTGISSHCEHTRFGRTVSVDEKGIDTTIQWYPAQYHPRRS